MIAGGAIGLMARDANAARRGYGGPSATSGGNGSAAVVGRPSGQPGRCRIGCAVSGIPGAYPLEINVVGMDGMRSVVDERFRVTASNNGDAFVVTQGAVDGSTECFCTVWWDGHLISSDFEEPYVTC